MKTVFAVTVLLFLAYCLVQVISKWKYRSGIEKTIWFLLILGGGYWAVGALVT